jgi:ABC-type amino acid transport substrate-binding protein
MELLDALKRRIANRWEALWLVLLFAATQLWGALTDVRAVLWAQGGRAALAAQLGFVVLGSVVVVLLAYWILLPRPKLVDLPSQQFAKDFVVLKWDYDAHVPGVTHYEVLLDYGFGFKRRSPTETRYAAVAHFGEFLVKVRAKARGKFSRTSDCVRVSVYRDALDRILKRRRMVVAIHPDNTEGFFCRIEPPGNDDREGKPEYQGLDIQLVDGFRRHLEKDGKGPIAVQYLLLKWDEILAEPGRCEIDFAIASITISQERAARHRLLFSRPYWHSRLALVYDITRAKGDDKKALLAQNPFPVRCLHALDGVGVHSDTTATEIVAAHCANATIARTNPELFKALTNAEVQAVVYDEERVKSELSKHPSWKAVTLDEDVQAYGIAMAPASTDLKQALDDFLEGWEEKARKATSRTIEPARPRTRMA